jgi:hypothetical protein
MSNNIETIGEVSGMEYPRGIAFSWSRDVNPVAQIAGER